jgi:glutamine synthetase adenylyltransferase
VTTRIAHAAAASRPARPTVAKLTAQLATLDTAIAAKKKELTHHKDVMARSRYTPEGLVKATATLKKLEKELASLTTQRKAVAKELAALAPKKPPSEQALLGSIETHLRTGTLDFSGKAPKQADILTAASVTKRPFTYTAIVLKSDPTQVIIKKTLTGGFVPPRPGDGVYSRPVPLKP